MTVDHIVPKCAGGKSTWANLVAACADCNRRKRDRTPAQAGMPLRRNPREPEFIPFIVVRRNALPAQRALYLYPLHGAQMNLASFSSSTRRSTALSQTP